MITRFSVLEADFEIPITSSIWTGRPLRAATTPYIRDWEENRQEDPRLLLAKGIVPLDYELAGFQEAGSIPGEVEEQSVMRYMAHFV